MREIKYRAWEKTRKIMGYTDKDLRVDLDSDGEYVCNSQFDFEDYELMEYTGIKDKNGKEVYESDILKVPSAEDNLFEIVEVYWSDKEAAWYATGKESDDSLSAFINDGFNPEDNGEVIGNAFENPELLEVKQ
jgi:uncharacterized phage protein (TIGR01671 family)